jgi:Xaa-Pro aminopeptidase
MIKKIEPFRVDTEWLKSGAKVEYQPRRTFGAEACDYQERVNYDRLRKERLQRLKASMEKNEFSALLLNLGDSIRYATSTWDQIWRMANQTRYCVVPLEGDPILFETVGTDLEVVRMNCPWMEDRIRPALTYRHAGVAFGDMLKKHVEQVKNCFLELGVNPKKDKIGYDTMDVPTYLAFKEAGVDMVPAMPAIIAARVVKTKDELELLKIACAMCDTCFWHLKYEWVKPGVTEKEVVGKINEYLFGRGMQIVLDGVVAAGGNTNPYHRSYTDRVIRQGDMVIIDLAPYAFNGYVAYYVRCWPVEADFTAEQKEIYKKCYNSMYAAINEIKPGATTGDVAAHFPIGVDDDEGTSSLLQFGHSVGLTLYEGYWMSRAYSLDHPMPIEQNMYFAVETYVANPGGQDGARLEENLVVTDTGYQCYTLFPFEEEVLGGTPVGELIP